MNIVPFEELAMVITLENWMMKLYTCGNPEIKPNETVAEIYTFRIKFKNEH